MSTHKPFLARRVKTFTSACKTLKTVLKKPLETQLPRPPTEGSRTWAFPLLSPLLSSSPLRLLLSSPILLSSLLPSPPLFSSPPPSPPLILCSPSSPLPPLLSSPSSPLPPLLSSPLFGHHTPRNSNLNRLSFPSTAVKRRN